MVVWLGNPSGRGAETLVGIEAAAPLALRLIAALEDSEHPAPWEDPDDSNDDRPLPASRHITLLSPVDNTQILLDSDQAADRQQVLLRAVAADPAHPRLWWFVDATPAGTCSSSEPLFWRPVPGRHQVKVVDASGRSATVRIVVK